MFRSLLCKLGARTTSIINGESSSSSAKYCLFTAFQNPNVVIPKSRVTNFIFYSTSNLACSDSNSESSFVVSYLINSCGLSETEAITASKKLNFKTTSNPDSVLTLLKTYGFTESHISQAIIKYPAILSSKPDKILKPRLDFFKSKGLFGIDLANVISKEPWILRLRFDKIVIPCFETLKTIVHSDQNVLTMIRRNNWLLRRSLSERLMVNIELLRNEGVPEVNISKYLIQQPRTFMENADRFKEIVEKVKEMGFNHLQTRFLRAVIGLASMTEANWREKTDVYKRWGWSEVQIQIAFRKDPGCMTVSEKKIMAVMNFLVNEMGYDSSSVAESPIILNYSLKDRIIPRCYVSRILVSKGLINRMIALSTISTKVDKGFVKNFVSKYEPDVPELMKVFEGQLNYQDLLQS